MIYLFDTNILVNSIRHSEYKRFIEHTYFKSENSIIISVVTEAELKTIAYNNNWGQSKLKEIEIQLSQITIIPIKSSETVKTILKLTLLAKENIKRKELIFPPEIWEKMTFG